MNTWRLSALNTLILLGAATLAGCQENDGTADFAAAQAAYEAGDCRKAEKCFVRGLEAAPDKVDALVYLARIKLAAGELAAAQGWIDKAAAREPAAVDVRLISAQLAWHAKDYARASKIFTDLAQEKGLSAEVRSEAWTGLGIVEMACNEAHLARVDFLRAIRLNRKNAAAWYHLGLLYRDAPFVYLEAALEQFEIFVRLDEMASPRVQKTQRQVIPDLREAIARAAADRKGAANRNSTASATALAKAEAAWKKGNFKLARQHYEEALTADALSYPAALGLAKARLKTEATKPGQLKALANYKQACALRPGAVSTYLAAAELAVRLDQQVQAVEIYSRAVAANPTSIPALDGLIRALRKVGGSRKAADAYQAYREMISRAGK